MTTGCILKAVSMLGTATASSTGILYLFRGLNGLGDCFIMVCAYPYIISFVEKRSRNTVYSLLFSISILSPFFGNVISGLTVSRIKSYEVIIIISAIIVSIGAILRCFLPASVKESSAKSIKLYFPCQAYVRTYLVYELLGYGAYFTAYSMMNIICRDRMGLSDGMTGLFMGTMTLVSGIVLFIVPVVAGRVERTKVNTAVITALTILYMIMIFVRGWLFLILVIITAAMQCMMGGLMDGPVLGKIPEEEKGGFSGLRLLLINAGTSLGVFSAGLLIKTGDISIIYFSAFILTLVQFFLFVYGIKGHINNDLNEREEMMEECVE